MQIRRSAVRILPREVVSLAASDAIKRHYGQQRMQCTHTRDWTSKRRSFVRPADEQKIAEIFTNNSSRLFPSSAPAKMRSSASLLSRADASRMNGPPRA